jgi:hypothetical protein
MSVSACAARQPNIGIVGQGTAFVLPRDAAAPQDPGAAYPPWAIGGGMQLARGSYELELWFDIPRAQLVDWTVTCPGVEVTGTAGESLEQYKARRIEELRAARGHQQVASLTMVPSDDPIELPHGDVGAGRLASTVRVMTGGAGVCAVTATADDASVLGTYQVTRIRDPHLEARARSTSQHAAAIQVRGRVPAIQVAYDPARVERQLAADRAAAEYQLQREADARMQMQLAAQRQAEIDAHRERLIVDVEQRRLDIAQRARDDLRRRWVAWGAIPRPPMPALLAEEAGEPPFPGARWTPGTWQWVNGQWTWRAGFWSNPDVFDDAGGDLTVGIGMGFDFDLSGGGSDEESPRVRDHHRKGPRIRDHHKPEPIVRDHYKPEPVVRDHPKPEPTVRDHPKSSREEPKSTIRVHEKDDKKDEDKGGRVRNHYR